MGWVIVSAGWLCDAEGLGSGWAAGGDWAFLFGDVSCGAGVVWQRARARQLLMPRARPKRVEAFMGQMGVEVVWLSCARCDVI